MSLPAIDTPYMIEFLTGLLNTPSPTGFAEAAIAYTEKALSVYPELTMKRVSKGALLVTWPGQHSDKPRCLTAHVDTLGAMVKEIKSNGRLQLTPLGGGAWNTVEGEGLNVFTSDGKKIRGCLLMTKASGHIFGKLVNETKREDDTMEVRLDERTSNAEETRALGIEVGDFVAYDPRVEVVNGFIRSRHLDDKACVANILTAIKAMHDAGLKPMQKTYILIANYEEVGLGAASGVPEEVTELLAVDMAAVGGGQNSDEFHASLCVKDAAGPYHHGLSQHMRDLAKKYKIPYKVDIFTYYVSDGMFYWRSGGSAPIALIGPGIDASHNYERTHMDSLVATTQWVLAYLIE